MGFIMICPECGSTKVSKAKVYGKNGWICNSCNTYSTGFLSRALEKNLRINKRDKFKVKQA